MSLASCGSGTTPFFPVDTPEDVLGADAVEDSSAEPDSATDIDEEVELGEPDTEPDVVADTEEDGEDGADVDVATPTEVVLSGTVRYEDREFGPTGFTGNLPLTDAPRVLVRAESADGDVTFDETHTDENGAFSLAVPSDGAVRVRAFSVGEFDGFSVHVRDRTGESALYELATDAFEPAAPPSLALVATADIPMGGALNIVHQTMIGFDFIARFSDERSPTLTYFWQDGLSYSCGSCYSDNAIRLGGQTADPDQYDDDIILHEFAHYLVEHFTYDDSPGGSHRDRLVDPYLAYGEGLAYFLSSAIRNDPTMVDNYLGDLRFIDYEAVTIGGASLDDFFGTSDGTVEGRRREEISAALLWDAFDGPNDDEPWDVVSMGDDVIAALFEALNGRPSTNVGPRGVEITDALNALACRLGETDGLQALVDERQFPWSIADNLVCD